MSVIYSSTLRSARMQEVIDAIDAGTAPGSIEICTAAYASVLVSITLDDPSFSESGAVITMRGVPRSGTVAANGTAAIARIKDNNGNIAVSGLTVGTSDDSPAPEVILNSVELVEDQTVTLSSGTITHS